MTSATRDLLIEIGTEELPPKALPRLSRAFSDGVRKGLIQADLAFGEVHDYAAPRRLALWIEAVAATQADREQIRRGPALAAAFDDEGNPTPGAQGFARSCGVGVEQLEKLETDKGAWLVHRVMERGRDTAELIPAIVDQALGQLPIPKRMRWGAGTAEFVRPVHWIVLLFGDAVIDTEILGVKSGRETRGHRFHHPAPIYIGEPAAYAPLLQTKGRVLADFAERRAAIRGQVIAAGVAAGGRALIDEDLLDEVTALVEWPVAVTGDFETRFLEVPSEALISTMQDNQKYFPVVDGDGRLLPHFITLSNIVSRDPAQVKAGNERVVRPRLADAAFFWNQDRKQRLEARIDRLGTMVFQSRLGTLLDKQKRVARLAAHIAVALGADARLAERAAMLAKCDLLTQMVFEFPELQGVMGRYYAQHDGEPEEVAQAIDEQYRPRFAGDALPQTATGQALAIADRLDTLVGIFAIGQPPTGDKDPFALRRAALGVLRILIEGGRDLDLAELIATAAAGFPAALGAGAAVDGVFEFMMERLRAYYTDAGIAHPSAGFPRPTARGDRIPRTAGGGESRRGQQAHRQHPAQDGRDDSRGGRDRTARRRGGTRSGPGPRRAARRSGKRVRPRRLHCGTAPSGDAARAGRPLLRPRHGHGRGCRAARQPARAAAAAAVAVPAGGGSVPAPVAVDAKDGSGHSPRRITGNVTGGAARRTGGTP